MLAHNTKPITGTGLLTILATCNVTTICNLVKIKYKCDIIIFFKLTLILNNKFCRINPTQYIDGNASKPRISKIHKVKKTQKNLSKQTGD